VKTQRLALFSTSARLHPRSRTRPQATSCTSVLPQLTLKSNLPEQQQARGTEPLGDEADGELDQQWCAGGRVEEPNVRASWTDTPCSPLLPLPLALHTRGHQGGSPTTLALLLGQSTATEIDQGQGMAGIDGGGAEQCRARAKGARVLPHQPDSSCS